jgi:flagella basal body P-ring formation protein FlgA
MQSGTDGEFIKIRNTRSKKEFQAKVVDEKTVKVYF